MTQALLDVEDLRVAYGSRAVLNGVDVRVARGEVVGLLGRTGSGKTTLLRAISGVTPYASGRILVGGDSVATMPRRNLSKRVAVVPQAPALPAGFTAMQVVIMGRTPHLRFFAQEGPGDLQRARQALEVVGAGMLRARLVEHLSGGERQKVAVARCLAQDASILLLDEPTAHLDIAHQISIARLVRGLAQESGLAVLAAMHDLSLAALYCDRLVLLSDGTVLADGAPDAVITNDNIALAYGTQVNILRTPEMPGPVIAPYSAALSPLPSREGHGRGARSDRLASSTGENGEESRLNSIWPSPIGSEAGRSRHHLSVAGELGAAIRILTRFPLPAGTYRGSGAAAFGLVGVGLGLIASVPVVLLSARLPLLAAVLSVGFLALASGALHLDGLADTADALAAVNVEAGERALKDPRIGPAGAVALVLVLALDIASIAGLARSPATAAWAIVVATAVSRGLSATAAPWVPRADQGFGAWFANNTPIRAALAAALLPLALSLVAGITGLIALAAATLAGVGTLVIFARRFGSVTGDAFGAAIELSFTAALVAALVSR